MKIMIIVIRACKWQRHMYCCLPLYSGWIKSDYFAVSYMKIMLSKTITSALSIIRRSPFTLRSISTYPTDTADQMTITDDGQVIVCWHPEKPFPYECSKPLPPPEAPSTSIYKMEDKEEIYKVFKDKKIEFVREELMKMTHTTKHLWFPKSRRKYRKNTPMDRPYL